MNTAIQKELSQSGVLLIKLNRPEVLNAMNKDLIIGLLETFNEIKAPKSGVIKKIDKVSAWFLATCPT